VGIGSGVCRIEKWPVAIAYWKIQRNLAVPRIQRGIADFSALIHHAGGAVAPNVGSFTVSSEQKPLFVKGLLKKMSVVLQIKNSKILNPGNFGEIWWLQESMAASWLSSPATSC
jgi:hypothetical protein